MPTEFPTYNALAPIKTELAARNETLFDDDSLNSATKEGATFLSPSPLINGLKEELSPVILRDRHHRSAELPAPVAMHDNKGGFYTRCRLKGNGLYSGPREDWLYKIRNIKKDATGYVLGLQPEEVFTRSLKHSRMLREMGIETEVPIVAYGLSEVIYQLRSGVARLTLADALKEANLPEEYNDVPFTIRMDAFGINHRLVDFIHAETLFPEDENNAENVREIILKEVENYLIQEAKYNEFELPDFNNLKEFCRFIIARIMRNLGRLHKNGGIHGMLTPHNLTIDGKFVDYDTLKWLTGEQLKEGQTQDLQKLRESVFEFLTQIFDPIEAELIIQHGIHEYSHILNL